MFLYEAVIDNADCRQLLSIKGRLARLDRRLARILPRSQCNVFSQPEDDQEHPREIDIFVAIDGGLTRLQLKSLEQEVEATIGRKQTAPATQRPRIVERLVSL